MQKRKNYYDKIGPTDHINRLDSFADDCQSVYAYKFFNSNKVYVKSQFIYKGAIRILHINKKLDVSIQDLLTMSTLELLHKYLDDKLKTEYGLELKLENLTIIW